ncbi:MAG: cbb3-type cytochrome c oxidase subunit 3 [Rhodocyclaceae bacterium]|nr:cbb3-type cytochrome c oxidase subunit 3 [Rhodocyclaceae bacterium]
MDINDLRSIFTVLAFVMFAGIVWWAYSGRRKQAYEEAAQLPLDDDLPVIDNGGRAAGQSDK